VNFERSLETQRLKLLRIVAGLLFAIGFLSVGPVSRGFSVWVCGCVESVLSRAELAARYLVIAQARLIAAQHGLDFDVHRFSETLAPVDAPLGTEPSVAECRARLWALRAVLMNVRRHALRVLRRIEKQVSDSNRVSPPRFDPCRSSTLCARRRAAVRIERPPDKGRFALMLIPSLPGCRVGGACG